VLGVFCIWGVLPDGHGRKGGYLFYISTEKLITRLVNEREEGKGRDNGVDSADMSLRIQIRKGEGMNDQQNKFKTVFTTITVSLFLFYAAACSHHNRPTLHVGYQDAVRSLIPVNLEGLRANAAKSTIGG
jgi:hypothetical protein